MQSWANYYVAASTWLDKNKPESTENEIRSFAENYADMRTALDKQKQSYESLMKEQDELGIID